MVFALFSIRVIAASMLLVLVKFIFSNTVDSRSFKATFFLSSLKWLSFELSLSLGSLLLLASFSRFLRDLSSLKMLICKFPRKVSYFLL